TSRRRKAVLRPCRRKRTQACLFEAFTAGVPGALWSAQAIVVYESRSGAPHLVRKGVRFAFPRKRSRNTRRSPGRARRRAGAFLLRCRGVERESAAAGLSWTGEPGP